MLEEAPLPLWLRSALRSERLETSQWCIIGKTTFFMPPRCKTAPPPTSQPIFIIYPVLNAYLSTLICHNSQSTLNARRRIVVFTQSNCWFNRISRTLIIQRTLGLQLTSHSLSNLPFRRKRLLTRGSIDSKKIPSILTTKSSLSSHSGRPVMVSNSMVSIAHITGKSKIISALMVHITTLTSSSTPRNKFTRFTTTPS